MIEEEGRVIQACLAGNREAFEILVNRYEAHVKALAWTIVRNPEDALEISQETFLQAFKNLRLFDPSRNFKNWLLGITVKRSLDNRRRQKSFLNFFKRYSLEAPLVKEEIKPLDESPLFHPLLNHLKERERIALSLQINESCTAKEIGEVLHCSENSARVLLFTSRKKLKKIVLANTTQLKKNKTPRYYHENPNQV